MKLPEIQSQNIDGDEGVFNLGIPLNHDIFQGHFPGYPILAGVAQLDWAMHFSAYLGNDKRAAQNFKVKFHKIIAPDTPLVLRLKFDRVQERLYFTYYSEEKIMSRGEIMLKVPA